MSRNIQIQHKDAVRVMARIMRERGALLPAEANVIANMPADALLCASGTLEVDPEILKLRSTIDFLIRDREQRMTQ